MSWPCYIVEEVVLEQPLPDDGRDPRAILDVFREAVLPHPMGNGHPRFFGWVNSPPAPTRSALAELLTVLEKAPAISTAPLT